MHKLIFLGPAGSGKDTQADLLAKKLRIKKLSVGQLLREEIEKNSVTGRVIKPYLDRGEMVPRKVVLDLTLSEILKSGPQEAGYVISSFPRTMSSFRAYFTLDKPTTIIVLELSDDECVKRLLVRGREDDYIEVIKTRLALYHQEDEKTIEWIKTNTNLPVFRVPASGTIEQIHEQILKLL